MENIALEVWYGDYNGEYVFPVNSELTCDLMLNLSADEDVFVLLRAERYDGEWKLCAGEHVKLADSREISRDVLELRPGTRFTIFSEVLASPVHAVVVSGEALDPDFKKYCMTAPEITIGAAADNTVCYSNKEKNNGDSQRLVSGHHAKLLRQGDSWVVIDNPLQKQGGTNGVFVNGKRIQENQLLKFGDEVRIIGLRLLFLGEILAVGMVGGGELRVTGLTEYRENTAAPASENGGEQPGRQFNRTPRKIEAQDLEKQEIEAPPAFNKAPKRPLFMTIGPSFTMMIPMLMGVMFSYFATQKMGGTSSPMMFMGIVTSVSSAFIGVMWALANMRYAKKQETENEKNRVEKYSRYLEDKAQDIKAKTESNRRILLEAYPTLAEWKAFAQESGRRLWERNINQPDFLGVRLGTAELDNQIEIVVPKDKFSVVGDPLSSLPAQKKEELVRIADMPVVYSFLENPLTGVVADDRESLMNTVRTIAMQIAYTHAYTDVKMAFLYPKNESKYWQFAHWLPHTWMSEKSLRLTASDEKSAADVLYHIAEEMRVREEEADDSDNKKKMASPHYVVFLADPSLLEGEAAAKYILNPAAQSGISTVLACGKMDLLPNNCTNVIENSRDYRGYFSIEGSYQNISGVEFDFISEKEALEESKKLSSVFLAEKSSGGSIPAKLTFMEMSNVGRVEDMNILRHWQENHVYEGIKSVLGQKSGSKPICLDISEKAHGPHGLMAGTTGSGKSETLQTFILSLACTYHPHELTFLLIDYKGGGMANSFIGLPHLVGIITNLSGNQTNRALISLNSEIKRRERIFNEYQIKHIDTYIEMYRSGQVDEPLAHLVIVADEFAELKNEQPEFIQELVRISRVGRSLGVHLVLATQQPDKAIDDEIWNNSKFHICLRVQSKDASKRVINHADAAYLTNPGAGYFQVGSDEIYEQFQSGWSGAPYDPSAEFDPKGTAEAHIISECGLPCVVRAKKKSSGTANKKTQLDAIVEYTGSLAQSARIQPVKAIWTEPLNNIVLLEQLEQYADLLQEDRNSMQILLGLMDDPANQAHIPYIFDLIRDGNTRICGSTATGKTSVLQTMLYALSLRNSPAELQYYIMDFNSRILSAFAQLPHCSGFISDLEADKASELLKLVQNEITRRKQVFADKNCASFKEYRRKYTDVPAAILVIDGYASFAESAPKAEDLLVRISREGPSYGLYMMVTTSAANELLRKVNANMSHNIAIQLKDKSDYETVLGMRVPFLAQENTPGRALVCSGRLLECQLALVCSGGEEEYQEKLREKLELVKHKWANVQPAGGAKIRQLPKDLSYAAFRKTEEYQQLDPRRVLPYGYLYNDASAACLDLTSLDNCFIRCEGEEEKRNLMEMILDHAKLLNSHIFVMDAQEGQLREMAAQVGASYSSGAEELKKLIAGEFIPTAQKYGAVKKEKAAQGTPLSWPAEEIRPICVVIADFDSVRSQLDECGKEFVNFISRMSTAQGRCGTFLFAFTQRKDGVYYAQDALYKSLLQGKKLITACVPVQQPEVPGDKINREDRLEKLKPYVGYAWTTSEDVSKFIAFHSNDEVPVQ